MSMITATTWVRRGVSAPFPEKYEIDEEEMNRISELAKVQLQDARADLKEAQAGQNQQETEMEVEEENKDKSEDSSKKASVKSQEYVFFIYVPFFFFPLTSH